MLTESLQHVFRTRRAWVLAATSFVIIALIIILVPNIAFVRDILATDILVGGQKLKTLVIFVASFGVNATGVSVFVTLVLGFLFSLYIVSSVYLWRRRRRAGALGVVGAISGMFGVGCAACGSLLLSTVIASAGAAAFLAGLPLGGQEFAIIGIVLLCWALYINLKKVGEPMVCKS